jgi:flagellar M-ring protein FliF
MMELKEPIVVGAQIFGQVRDRWEQLDPRRRLALVVILVGVVGSLGLWMFLSSQVPYQVAFQNLRADDEAAVVDKLKEFQIPYEIDDGGTIRVPASLVNEARVRVAGAGVLKGSAVGFEIFNQPAFGISDFVQQVNYQRALEGELERSIEQIDGIQSARVHLAIPQPSVFLRQQRDPSAAVIIGLKPGRTIDKAQEQAIVNLVVGAVEGMKPSQVVLLDTRGQLLHKEGDSGGIGTLDVGDQYATQRAMEQDLASRLQNLLDRVVGPGRGRADQRDIQPQQSTAPGADEPGREGDTRTGSKYRWRTRRHE